MALGAEESTTLSSFKQLVNLCPFTSPTSEQRSLDLKAFWDLDLCFLNRLEFSQDRGLIAKDRQEVEAIEPQRGIVDHYHHTVTSIKEGLESRGCLNKRIGKSLIQPLLSQWLQLLESYEQILLTGGSPQAAGWCSSLNQT